MRIRTAQPRAGFTLTEAAFVTVLLSLVASLAVPAFTAVVDRVRGGVSEAEFAALVDAATVLVTVRPDLGWEAALDTVIAERAAAPAAIAVAGIGTPVAADAPLTWVRVTGVPDAVGEIAVTAGVGGTAGFAAVPADADGVLYAFAEPGGAVTWAERGPTAGPALAGVALGGPKHPGAGPSGQAVAALAVGSATGATAQLALALPGASAATSDGANIYVATASTVYRWSPRTGDLTLIKAGFSGIRGLALAGGRNLYVSENSANRYRVLDLVTGQVRALLGTCYPEGITSDGTRVWAAGRWGVGSCTTSSVTEITEGTLGGYTDVARGGAVWRAMDVVWVAGNLYHVDLYNHRVYSTTPGSSTVTTIAGSGAAGFVDGTGTGARFNNPRRLSTDGTHLYVSDTTNNAIRRVNITSRAVTTLVTGLTGHVVSDGADLYVANSSGLWRLDPA